MIGTLPVFDKNQKRDGCDMINKPRPETARVRTKLSGPAFPPEKRSCYGNHA